MGQRPVSKCKAHWVNPERDRQNTYMKHQQEKITEATMWLRSLRSIFYRHRVTLLFSPVLSYADKLRGWTHRRTLLRSFRSPMLTQLQRVYRRAGPPKRAPSRNVTMLPQELGAASYRKHLIHAPAGFPRRRAPVAPCRASRSSYMRCREDQAFDPRRPPQNPPPVAGSKSPAWRWRDAR
jgi:hypothetical protein